ncbi:MAG: LytR C-terminal domain-containing protein [Lachnospiraceae bacterium]|jgi:hypothetical protein|nr:LytR C-terminal domain-containing protein [Lachnospiraceae bacterium]MEE3460305.1 LytR C-terminal domain-containing protein [Lachnospiraceae bacterium]
MEKKKAVKLFFINLLKSILIIAVVLGFGFGVYKGSYYFLHKQMLASNEKAKSDDKEKAMNDLLSQAKIDDTSKNLIFAVDDAKKIRAIVLEICSSSTGNLDMVSIPVRTEYTLPTELFQKLSVVNPDIPQIIRFGRLFNYFQVNTESDFKDEDIYGYSSLIIGNVIGTEISYYSVVPFDKFREIFRMKYRKVSFNGYGIAPEPAEDDGTAVDGNVQLDDNAMTFAATDGAVIKQRIARFKKPFVEQLNGYVSNEDDFINYIRSIYSDGTVTSNLSVDNKIAYIKTSYNKIKPDFIHYWGLPGTYDEKIFHLDTEQVSRNILGLENNTTPYSASQTVKEKPAEYAATGSALSEGDGTDTSSETSGTGISSKGKKILILNGTDVNGLAASFKTKLQTAGFTIGEVGDYTEKGQTDTQILVTGEGMGNDLKKYFKDPEIVVSNSVRIGYDIEIILGSEDS